MTNSVLVLPLGFRVTDSSGDPVSGAQIRFFEAGTTTPKTVYSDETLSTSLGSIVYTRSDGFPVSAQNGSTTVGIYIGTGLYKMDILDADSVTILPAKDNVQGAVAVTDAGTPVLTTPVLTETGTISVDATFNGKLVRGNTSGGSVTANLAAAATLGDGWTAKFVKSAAANTLNITPAGADTINGLANVALKDQFDFVELHCDGAAFYVGARGIRARDREIGDVRLASVSGARTGELECNGASVLRSDYPALFLAIGTQHGAADGTHFNLPHYTGYHLRFWDHTEGVDPDAASRTAPASGGNTGDNPGTHQADAVKTHTHSTTVAADGGSRHGSAGTNTGANLYGSDGDTLGGGTASKAFTSGNPSTGAANETRGKNVNVVGYILAVTF
jgi:microcystin-dependent protein